MPAVLLNLPILYAKVTETNVYFVRTTINFTFWDFASFLNSCKLQSKYEFSEKQSLQHVMEVAKILMQGSVI